MDSNTIAFRDYEYNVTFVKAKVVVFFFFIPLYAEVVLMESIRKLTRYYRNLPSGAET